MSSALETVGPRAGAAPLAYTLTETGTVDLQSAFAHFDGTAASGDWRPALTIRAQNGTILSRTFPPDTLATGDTADVTYAPFLSRGGTSAGPAPGGLTQGIRVYNTVDQAIPNATWTALVFSTASWSYNATFDPLAPSQITVTRSGVYVIRCAAIFAVNNIGVRYIGIGVNGVPGTASAELPEGRDPGTGTNYAVQATDILLLSAGDTVSAFVHQTSGGPLNAVATGGTPPGGSSLAVGGWFLT